MPNCFTLTRPFLHTHAYAACMLSHKRAVLPCSIPVLPGHKTKVSMNATKVLLKRAVPQKCPTASR